MTIQPWHTRTTVAIHHQRPCFPLPKLFRNLSCFCFDDCLTMTLFVHRICGGFPILVSVLFLLLAVCAFAPVRGALATSGGEEGGVLGTDASSQATGSSSSSSTTSSTTLPDDYYRLSKESVVLITGAAGFLGTELAIALHRTYQPKKIICIDSMAVTPPWGPTTKSKTSSSSLQYLHRLEYQRQRIFRLMQALGSVVHFYRVDFRVHVPEFYVAGEVPILNHIVSLHPDITHIVHLAEDTSPQRSHVISRLSPDSKAGMMETLLEELRAWKVAHGNVKPLPHLVYASSHQVYNPKPSRNHGINPVPFREDLPLTSPTSLEGASKLMDEVLAQAYYDMDAIPSIGLRFFDVYGPWGHPQSLLYQMAEHAVLTHPPSSSLATTASPPPPFRRSDLMSLQSTCDFIYIDDAIDAILTSMQIQAMQPIVINVGTGIATSWQQLVSTIQTHLDHFHVDVPSATATTTADHSETTTTTNGGAATTVTQSVASTARSQALLGLQPRVDLATGLERTLAWHYDRAHPYGSGAIPPPRTAIDHNNNNNATAATSLPLSSKGLGQCETDDVDCELGAPVFYCAATECAHETQCLTSFWDDVVEWTRLYTQEFGCDQSAVLYTVALDEGLTTLLPWKSSEQSNSRNANSAQSMYSRSYLRGGRCNIAFVADDSALVRRLLQDPSSTTRSNNPDLSLILTHGPWTLVPVSVTRTESQTGGSASASSPALLPEALRVLPKWSPSSFFVSKIAIYIDPRVVFENIDHVLQEFVKLPPVSITGNTEHSKSATSLMIGSATPDVRRSTTTTTTRRSARSTLSSVQETAYRMIRIAAIDEMNGDGFSTPLDSTSYVVHRTDADDARLFRCDVMQEILQWDVQDEAHDAMSLQFVMGLHDMWSRVIAKREEQRAWWAMSNMQEKAQTTPSPDVSKDDKTDKGSRDKDGNRKSTKKAETVETTKDKGESPESQAEASAKSSALEEALENKDAANANSEELDDTKSAEKEDPDSPKAEVQETDSTHRRLFAVQANGGAGDEPNDMFSWGQESAFGMPEAIQEAVRAVFGDASKRESVDDFEEDEADEVAGEKSGARDGFTDANPPRRSQDSDSIWMGVLSSADVVYYCRVVPSDLAGVLHLDDFTSSNTA